MRILSALIAVVFLYLNSNLSQAEQVEAGVYLVKPLPGLIQRRSATIMNEIDRAGDVVAIRRNKNISTRSAGTKFVPLDPNDSTCRDLMQTGNYEYCEPNFKISLSNIPQHEHFEKLSNLAAIGAVGAWDKTTGSDNVVVAVIDTGIDYRHPDLAANVWSNPGEIPGNGIDDDNDGYVDDVYGINSFDNNGDPFDTIGHGTHVSGTIGAVGGNNLGIVGINWRVKIMPLKFMGGTDGGGTILGALKAIDFMIKAKKRYSLNLKVCNASWNSPDYSESLRQAIARAQDADILFVTSAGNDGLDNDSVPTFPANFNLPNIISVAAVDNKFRLQEFSNFGVNKVAIAAPGVSVLSTLPGASYGTLSGTSMSAPHVSGALALLLSAHQTFSAKDLKVWLYTSVLPISELALKVSTGGVLSLDRLLLHNQNLSKPQDKTPVISSLEITNLLLMVDPLSTDTMLRPNGSFQLVVKAKGNSAKSEKLSLAFNGRNCESTQPVLIRPGKNIFKGRFNFTTPISNLMQWVSFRIGRKKIEKVVKNTQMTLLGLTKVATPTDFRLSCSAVQNSIH